KGVSNKNDDYKGFMDNNDDYKGVIDRSSNIKGVSNKNDDYKGFIDNNDDYKGVIDRSSNIKGVSNKNDDYKGVVDKDSNIKGVGDKNDDYKGVNINTNTYHPLNSTNTYHPLIHTPNTNTNTSHPFNNTFSLTSSNTRYIEILQLSIKYNLPVLLQGPTCTGKTALITYISKINNTPLIRINNHNNITRADYIGTYQLINNTCTFIYGPLLHCMLKGCYLLLDELNLAPSEVLEVLNRVLDCNREIYVDEIQQTVKCSKGFRVFCTQNVMYGGRKGLSEALRNRFVEVTVEQLTLEDIESIVRGSIKGREGVGGVNDSSSNYKGVKDSNGNYKGVKDSNGNYKGVNDSNCNYKGVNDRGSNYKGVNDSNCNYKGVGDSSSNYKGVGDSSSNYHPLNDSSSNYHPLNKCSNYHPLNKCSNYHPISNTTDTLHPLNNNNTIQHPLSTRIINKILSVYDSLRLYRNFNSLLSIRDILRWVRRKGVSEEEVYENGVMLLFERQRNYMDRCVVKGVLDDVFRGVVRSRGVSNSTSNYHPVSNSTSTYHPVSNSTSTYHPVSNSSNNYHPFNNSSNTSFVLTPSYLRMYMLIYTAWINKEPILLIGETGIGKTKMLEYVSNLMGVNIETFSCNSNTQTHDFIGYYTLGKGSNEEGVNDSSRLECVNDKEYELEGVSNKDHKLEGVSNKDYKLEGVNVKSPKQQSVNNTSNTLHPFSNIDSKQQGLSNSTNTLHPFSNIDCKQQGLSNSTNTLHPFSNIDRKQQGLNKTTNNLHPLNNSTNNYNPVSNSTNTLHPLNNNTNNNNTNTLFKYGPLVTAMRTGKAFLFDEINLTDDSVLERINSLLDDSNTLYIPETNETIYPNNNFILLATMNPGTDIGKKELSPALRSRFNEIYFDIPNNEIEGVMMDRVGYSVKGVSMRKVEIVSEFYNVVSVRSMLKGDSRVGVSDSSGGVTDSRMGVSNSSGGVNDSMELEGVNDSSTNYKGVSNKDSKLEGVSNKDSKLEGVSNKDSKLEGVSN
ncbi:putative AAA ATPase, partial [Hamiltosporidium magnivora]